MFITERVLDIVVTTKDQAFNATTTANGNAYALALSAFNGAHDLAISSKESEIRSLRAQVEDLTGQLKFEKARGDALVDRLLQKEAHVAAVAPLAAHVAKHQDDEAVKRLKVVFDQMGDMGDIPPPREMAEGRAFSMAGGSAVAA